MALVSKPHGCGVLVLCEACSVIPCLSLTLYCLQTTIGAVQNLLGAAGSWAGMVPATARRLVKRSIRSCKEAGSIQCQGVNARASGCEDVGMHIDVMLGRVAQPAGF